MGVRVSSEWLNSCLGVRDLHHRHGRTVARRARGGGHRAYPGTGGQQTTASWDDQKHLRRRRPMSAYQRRHPQRGTPEAGAGDAQEVQATQIALGTCATTAASRRWPTSWTADEMMERAFTTEPRRRRTRTRPTACRRRSRAAMRWTRRSRWTSTRPGPAESRPRVQLPGLPGAGQDARAAVRKRV